jgi:hypothetical protein
MVRKKVTKKGVKKKSEPIKAEKKFEYHDDAPIIVKLLSIFNYVNGSLWALIGLIFIFAANEIVSYVLQVAPELFVGYESGGLVSILIIGGIILVLFAVLYFFVGMGLWRLKPWARIVSIILSTIGVIGTIYSMIINFAPTQFLNIIIDGFIVGYLLFSKEAKEAFKKNKKLIK